MHVHVLAVVTVSVFFNTPARTILELLRDSPPVPVFSHPIDRGRTITTVHLKYVEARGNTEHDCGHGLPEAGPLYNTTVLINDFALLEGECLIRFHGGSLHEGLQLVAGMSWCTLNTKDSLDGLLLKDGVTETIGNMGKLLLVSPLQIVLGTLIVVVMGG